MSSFALHMKCHLSERLVNCPMCGKSVREEEVPYPSLVHSKPSSLSGISRSFSRSFNGEECESFLFSMSQGIRYYFLLFSIHSSHSSLPEQTFRDENEFLVHSMEKHARLQIFCTICSKIFGDDFSFKVLYFSISF